MTEYIFRLSDETPKIEVDVKAAAIINGVGQDLYDRAKKEIGFTGTFEEFLTKFKGERGERGEDGAIGAIGPAGERGADGLPGEKGERGEDGPIGPQGSRGERGQDGKSAYEIAVLNGYVGNEEQWLASLKGRDGSPGRDGRNGLSAYELADGELVFGTVGKWLASLKGAKGDTGLPGKSATVTIGTVTTGETASVTNTGTETEAVLNFVLPAGGGGNKGLHTEIRTVPVTVNAQQIQTVEFEAKFSETPTLHGNPALMGAGENRFLYLLSVDKNGFTCRSNYFDARLQTIHYAVTGKLA